MADRPVHLFVCWANNAGSTLAAALIEHTPGVAAMGIEGQLLPEFADLGPVPRAMGAALLFTEIADVLADDTAYDWPAIVELWNEQWDRSEPEAAVRVEKSTPDVCRAPLLARHFPPAAFVFGWRDPYAQVEGIMRARPGVAPERVARHAVECLRWQQRNLAWARAEGVPHVDVSYEALCADPRAYRRRCSDLLGIDVAPPPDEIVVKGRSGPVADTNRQQVDRLDPAVRAAVSAVLADDADLLGAFGYRVLDE